VVDFVPGELDPTMGTSTPSAAKTGEVSAHTTPHHPTNHRHH
jgi:hypothetical protein